MKLSDILNEKSSLWIFGYGSLVWRPDFKYSSSKVGYVKGYSRRFWHGDNFHRGTDQMLGRVVTLVEDNDACTWGVAYEVRGQEIEESLKYLNIRENVMGGYETKLIEFKPREEDGSVLALVYIATSDNPIYLGPASSEEIAVQIAVSSGKSGHNIEYLLRLAEFMRLACPEVHDEHLFAIEAATLSLLPFLIG
ncbi:glutathione-specific gamma-glutamylcyclotransferase 1 [Polypterus senegalus]|uniref:glutathione-specific gamma-glutamylcyclotransferase 1 n=1 Tax=Polypterus senegalus TaxID=55291 RepID=UPI001962D0C9|nr:glutathione-specific gamma-glutamylcyclotransferase 1 [Polypterus senegalus]